MMEPDYQPAPLPVEPPVADEAVQLSPIVGFDDPYREDALRQCALIKSFEMGQHSYCYGSLTLKSAADYVRDAETFLAFLKGGQ